MNKEEKKKSIDALESAALKAIKMGYLDLAAQIMFVAETVNRSDENKVVDLPPVIFTMRRDVAY